MISFGKLTAKGAAGKNLRATYAKGTLLLELFVNASMEPYVVSNVYFEELPEEKGG